MTEHNVLSESEKQEGWQLLFDGKNPQKHWRGFRQEELPDGWQVDEQALYRADKGGYIVTHEIYQDFELVLEWKNGGKGNSGVFFRVGEGGDEKEVVPFTGPEYQIINNDAQYNGQPISDKQKVGGNYDLHVPSKDVARPVGQWNDARIIVKGNHVEHWLNSEKVVEYELGSDDWKQRLAESKFSDWPNYGRLPEGHIALQDHGDPVWFRNIKIRRI